MGSSFFEFNVARSGLYAARGNLEVTNHNIANAQTEGFSRQYAQQRATWPMTYNNGEGMIGTGTEIYGIQQMRDFYLDSKYWSEQGVLGEYSSKEDNMKLLEKSFKELADTGVTNGFNIFFNTLQDLSTSAGDDAYRNNVLQAATGFSTFIRSTAATMKKQQQDVNEEIKIVVTTINSLGQQIASLNEQISKSELEGVRANDLRDSRARLVDELSNYVNIDVAEVERNEEFAAGKFPKPEDSDKSRKVFSVKINGHQFISGKDARALRVVARTEKQNPMDINGLVDIYFEGSNTEFNIYSPELKGQLKGMIDVRDGNNANHLKGSGATAAIGSNIVTLYNPSRLDIGGTGFISVYNDEGQSMDMKYSTVDNTIPGQLTFTTDTSIPLGFNAVNATVGEATAYKGVPHYMDKYNELVRTFSRAVNTNKDKGGNDIVAAAKGHEGSYDANDNISNLSLFVYENMAAGLTKVDDYNKINCENFKVNDVIINNPSLLAAEKSPNIGISGNNAILDYVAISTHEGLFAEGKLSDFIIGMSSELGVDVSQAKKFAENYADVTKSIDNQRLSVSGVSVNEEMINMVKYQQIYQASAKMITVIDNIYDTTINRMGLT